MNQSGPEAIPPSHVPTDASQGYSQLSPLETPPQFLGYPSQPSQPCENFLNTGSQPGFPDSLNLETSVEVNPAPSLLGHQHMTVIPSASVGPDLYALGFATAGINPTYVLPSPLDNKPTHPSLLKVEHRNSKAARRGPMDEMRQLVRILVKLLPTSVRFLNAADENGGGNRVSEEQIKLYLTRTLGPQPTPTKPKDPDVPNWPEWGLPEGWGAYVRELFVWATGNEELSREDAMACARRLPGRSWECVSDQLQKLGINCHMWKLPIRKSEVAETLREPWVPYEPPKQDENETPPKKHTAEDEPKKEQQETRSAKKPKRAGRAHVPLHSSPVGVLGEITEDGLSEVECWHLALKWAEAAIKKAGTAPQDSYGDILTTKDCIKRLIERPITLNNYPPVMAAGIPMSNIRPVWPGQGPDTLARAAQHLVQSVPIRHQVVDQNGNSTTMAYVAPPPVQGLPVETTTVPSTIVQTVPAPTPVVLRPVALIPSQQPTAAYRPATTVPQQQLQQPQMQQQQVQQQPMQQMQLQQQQQQQQQLQQQQQQAAAAGVSGLMPTESVYSNAASAEPMSLPTSHQQQVHQGQLPAPHQQLTAPGVVVKPQPLRPGAAAGDPVQETAPATATGPVPVKLGSQGTSFSPYAAAGPQRGTYPTESSAPGAPSAPVPPAASSDPPPSSQPRAQDLRNKIFASIDAVGSTSSMHTDTRVNVNMPSNQALFTPASYMASGMPMATLAGPSMHQPAATMAPHSFHYLPSAAASAAAECVQFTQAHYPAGPVSSHAPHVQQPIITRQASQSSAPDAVQMPGNDEMGMAAPSNNGTTAISAGNM